MLVDNLNNQNLDIVGSVESVIEDKNLEEINKIVTDDVEHKTENVDIKLEEAEPETEDAEPETEDAEPETDDLFNGEDNEELTITRKALRDIRDSEINKLLLDKQKEWDIEKDSILKNKQEEFEKYSKLTESERKHKEYTDLISEVNKQKELVDKQILEHSERVKQFNDDRLLESIEKDLVNNNLPKRLAPTLFKLGDAEKIKQELEEIKADFGVILKDNNAKYAQTKAPGVSNIAITSKNSKKGSISDMILEARTKKIK